MAGALRANHGGSHRRPAGHILKPQSDDFQYHAPIRTLPWADLQLSEPSRVLELKQSTSVARQSSETAGRNEFASFMRAYQDMVFSTSARIVANDAQAQDIAQEVFLKAFEHFDQLRGSTTAGGWLKKVATNLSLNHLSRYRKRWRFFSDMKSSADEDESPEPEFPIPDTLLADLTEEERAERIEMALKNLPEHQRVPLVLFHFEELPYDEIAAQLRVSLGKIKTDILRGRLALAKVLSRDELTEISAE
jgi:RNA polymerase sigma-70 factor (ECF subfamily)